uniref:Uncharacterized protein n=1 Tax=Branchiostoma floridae TaxID=7739 RepID=C3YKP0_BRAFL|eukprot:XP_002603097.1 hypothetical protein BRAFLDRAFT_63270 [Branchiostoma floridae]
MEENKFRARGSTLPESELRKLQRQRKTSVDVSACWRRVASVEGCTTSRQNMLLPSDGDRVTKLPPIRAGNRLVGGNLLDEETVCGFGQKAPFPIQARRKRKDTPAISPTTKEQDCLKNIWLEKMSVDKDKKHFLRKSSVSSQQHVEPGLMPSTRSKDERGRYSSLRLQKTVEKEVLPLHLAPDKGHATISVVAGDSFEGENKELTAKPYVDTWSQMAPMRPDRTSLETLPAVVSSDTGDEPRQKFYTNETDWGPVGRRASRQHNWVDPGFAAFGSFVEKNEPDCSDGSTEHCVPAHSVEPVEGEVDNAFVVRRKMGLQQNNEAVQWEPNSSTSHLQRDVSPELSRPSTTLPHVHDFGQRTTLTRPSTSTMDDSTWRNLLTDRKTTKDVRKTNEMVSRGIKPATAANSADESLDNRILQSDKTSVRLPNKRRRWNALVTGFKPVAMATTPVAMATTIDKSKALDKGSYTKQYDSRKKNYL